jgi:hypothetical protein
LVLTSLPPPVRDYELLDVFVSSLVLQREELKEFGFNMELKLEEG